MALADILRDQVASLSNIVDSFKGEAVLHAWIGQDGAGKDEFAAPIPVRAVISMKKEQRFTSGGSLVLTHATLTVLDTIADTTPNANQQREQPIDPRDKIILPDGSTAPVVDSGGPMDPATSRGFINKIVLGTVIRGQ